MSVGVELAATRMHIGIAGQIATEDLLHLLDAPAAPMPHGFPGAPFLGTLITELLARGHVISAFTLSNDMPLNDDAMVVAKGERLTLYCVPMRPRAWPFNGARVGRIVDLYGFERRGLERAMRLAAPDLIHAHWSYEFAWAALATGFPTVVTCHDSPLLVARTSTGPTRRGYRWLRAAMARYVLWRARHVTVVSPYMRDQIQDWCRNPVSIVANPVDARAFNFELPLRSGRARICMVCNGWGERKNPQIALRAFELFSKKWPDAELVICGDDFEPDGIAHSWWRSQRLSGRVEFRGRVGHEVVLSLMADSDVLLHPAIEESFGLVIAEALAIGLSVIAGASSGAVPWVVGDAGWLVDVTRPQAIADALAEVMCDAETARTKALLGRRLMRERFAASVVARDYELRYVTALGEDGL